MAGSFPPKLKAADLSRFAARAAQLEKLKPVVTYWCYYWIVNQILSKGLHKGDTESSAYTTMLMDKLEKMKSENAESDIITDDVASHAYVEQFALEVFDRADNAVRSNNVSGQTADTFQAAATFLELLQVWGPLDGEITSKTKYAKYHAVRIARAVRANEDPNLSNPAPTPPLEPDAQKIIDDARESSRPDYGQLGISRQPTVEGDDDGNAQYPTSFGLGTQPGSPNLNTMPEGAMPSPMDTRSGLPGRPHPPELDDRHLAHDHNPMYGESAGPEQKNVGYFPGFTAPSPERAPMQLPEAPPHDPGTPLVLPSAPEPDPAASDSAATSPLYDPRHQQLRQTLYHGQGGRDMPPRPFERSPNNDPRAPHYPTSAPGPPDQFYQNRAIPSTPAAPPSRAVVPPAAPSYKTDDEAIRQATKHARWAISALSFEDVQTAVKELQAAMNSLT
ncbi:MAG: hypothetical protein M1815_004308 [Lichina confinis]|nr:MAG: hypothetical protein M1815_004308 [Lichina confinis]